MSASRIVIAAVTLVVLAALMSWQYRREQQVKACVDGGGVWNGRLSACQPPLRPLLRRDLERS